MELVELGDVAKGLIEHKKKRVKRYKDLRNEYRYAREDADNVMDERGHLSLNQWVDMQGKKKSYKKAKREIVYKNDLVSERVKAGMSPSPISAPARAKNGRLLNLSTMGDRQPVLGRGKPFRNGKVVP
jgi:hypothetical protein